MKHKSIYCCLLLLAIVVISCKKAYEPDIIKTDSNFLVVDGFINTGTDATTKIVLARTRKLADTVTSIPEKNAVVKIQEEGGGTYTLTEKSDGTYLIEHLNLNSGKKYQLQIKTSSGSSYQSSFVERKLTPPIDSLEWKQDKDVTIYTNTHDASGIASKYYRWDYTETWEYHAEYDTWYGLDNGLIFYKDQNTQTYSCWRDTNSTGILLGSTVRLSENRISREPLTVVTNGTEKIGVKYSILVRQYPLDEGAYQYWNILKKNTEQTGTLFDPQPSQLPGNITCTNNENEQVIGYISAGNVEEKRIFIQNKELVDWVAPGSSTVACDVLFISQNPTNYLIFDYPIPGYGPYYFVSGGGLAITRTACLDCRLQGGTNKKPAFWQ